MAAPLYIPSQEKVQIGLEAAWGDLAVPTVQLVGITECKITPRVDASQIKDKRGTTMPAYIGTINKRWAECDIGGVVVYDHFMHWLNATFGIDAADPYAYLAELVPATAIRSFNILYGQTGVVHSMGGATLDKLTIRGDTNGPLTFSAHLAGKAAVTDTIETLTDDTVVVAMGHHCALWIDAIGSTIGTTPITVTHLSFEANIVVDRKLVWHLGAVGPDSFRHGKWEGGNLKLTLEMTAAMLVILDEILDEAVGPHGYMVRIRATDALTTSILTIDFAGQALTPPILHTDNDGVTTVELNLVPVYTADATFLSCWGADLDLP